MEHEVFSIEPACGVELQHVSNFLFEAMRNKFRGLGLGLSTGWMR